MHKECAVPSGNSVLQAEYPLIFAVNRTEASLMQNMGIHPKWTHRKEHI